MISIRRYSRERQAEWNDFVNASKNGTFLFHRDYMDYHADRFADHSIMAYRDDRLYALLPACQVGDTLYSHRGLTYGGLIMGAEATTAHVIEVFQALNEYLLRVGIHHVVYKAVPWIYCSLPSEEPLYAMHVACNCRLVERDVSSAIVMQRPLKWKKDRRHGLRLSLDGGVSVAIGTDYAAFWDILEENLRVNHHTRPVHSLDEIRLLQSRFPQNILLFEARQEGRLLGGCVVYATPQVVHTQYIAATPEGKRLGVVNALVAEMLGGAFPRQPYFDFGKSTEATSLQLNHQLIYQKEGFGARAICYDTYAWDV